MSRHVPRIYCETPLSRGERLSLPEDRAHHLMHVLRMKAGAAVILFDGRGGEYEATLATVAKHRVEVAVGAHRAVARESPLRLTLAQAISRGERMDYTIQKAVELGVTLIQPLETGYSQGRLDSARGEKKLTHWREIARSAAEQSGRERVPEVAAPLALETWLDALPAPAIRLLLDPDSPESLGAATAAAEVCLLSGPEGGFNAAEVARAKAAGFTALRLGPRILRTETAAVAALAVIQAQWGDLL